MLGSLLAIASTVLSLLLLDTTFYRGFASFSFCEPFSLLGWNCRSLLAPREHLAVKSNPVPLPKTKALVRNATIDVFGSEQAYALLSGLNYRPRPVFQSVAAYNSNLIRLNEAFYQSEAPPEFVLFGLVAIDRRFPSLEDSRVLLDLLVNYELVGNEDHFLLLQSRQRSTPEMSLLREGSATPDEQLLLATNAGALWIQIDMEPSFLGKLRRLTFKSPKVVLWVWEGDSPDRKAKFLAPPPMLSAGFLISPLLLENQTVADLYSGLPVTHPTAFAIKLPPGTERFWHLPFNYRIYRVTDQLGRHAPLTTAGSEKHAP